MDKKWIIEHEKENKIKLNEEVQKLVEKIEKSTTLSDEFKKINIDLLENLSEWNLRELEFNLTTYCHIEFDTDEDFIKHEEEFKGVDFSALMHLYKNQNLSRFEDSEPVEFDGDIIITDPCYILKEESNEEDWSYCEYGYNMENIGINHFMTRDTIYGDWSCTTFNTDTEEVIGEFCADAGLVTVLLLDEVLEYNPKFNYHIEKPWTTTLIKNFKGTVQFVVEREEGEYKETTKYYKKGEKWYDYSVRVIGHGFNKVTGEPINFIGGQTGL